jgi:hypothetical protein
MFPTGSIAALLAGPQQEQQEQQEVISSRSADAVELWQSKHIGAMFAAISERQPLQIDWCCGHRCRPKETPRGTASCGTVRCSNPRRLAYLLLGGEPSIPRDRLSVPTSLTAGPRPPCLKWSSVICSISHASVTLSLPQPALRL